MGEHEPAKSELENEIRNLGKNLESFFKSLWESEELRKAQQDISAGLNAAAESLERTATEISQSETGQRIRADVEDIHRRFESGEIQAKAREDAMNVLRRINSELEKAAKPVQENEPPKADE